MRITAKSVEIFKKALVIKSSSIAKLLRALCPRRATPFSKAATKLEHVKIGRKFINHEYNEKQVSQKSRLLIRP